MGVCAVGGVGVIAMGSGIELKVPHFLYTSL